MFASCLIPSVSARKKKKRDDKGLVVPSFMFGARVKPDAGNFKNVYGRLITYGEMPLTCDEKAFQKQLVKSWVDLRASASKLLQEVEKSDFSSDDYLRALARIETRASLLTRHAMIRSRQEAVRRLSVKLNHIVRLLYQPHADREVLWLLSLKVAKLVEDIEFLPCFKEPERSTLKKEIGMAIDLADAIASSSHALEKERLNYDQERAKKLAKSVKQHRDESERAEYEKKKRAEHFRLRTFQWKGGRRIDEALKVVDKGYKVWAGGWSPLSRSTDSILEALCDARAVLWQLHRKLKAEEAELLFEQMDFACCKLEVADVSRELRREVQAWKRSKMEGLQQKQSKAMDWKSMCSHSLVHRRERIVKYVKKQLLHLGGAADVVIGLEDFDFDLDLSFFDDLDIMEGFTDDLISIPLDMPEGHGEFSLNAAEDVELEAEAPGTDRLQTLRSKRLSQSVR
ncbi:hypothetical protein GUITHDRAFT_122834 [Guillardia theta CCMP2712]|uniref:Uncharacterized protein n=1 Tax=Guillardia theta (strain CCMP2712) TaxID=905079 RepID=L1I531_GUITC|nr:hypothetical protein GUITHDRAFT_122834 [Guillardia theta CCMP2712]EKX30960.1 hypothetical protein GUITHDRAFT_122834 [Guillardia theta CCMP2712]|eukprot:XP_005817940.1 hypothetical protein GUITHDRAFT_122834 [Guillardia theta CCMP2712]